MKRQLSEGGLERGRWDTLARAKKWDYGVFNKADNEEWERIITFATIMESVMKMLGRILKERYQ